MTAPVTIVNEIDGIKARLDALQANLDKQVADHAAAHSKALAAGVDNEIALRLIALGWTPPSGFGLPYHFVLGDSTTGPYLTAVVNGEAVLGTSPHSCVQFESAEDARKHRLNARTGRMAVLLVVPSVNAMAWPRVIEVVEAQ